MALSPEVSGLPHPTNLTDYSVSEGATPIDPANNAGGYGQIQLTTVDWDRSRFIRNTDIVLSDGITGRTSGRVRDVSGDDSFASITADNELGKFNVRRRADPFSGQFSALVQYYLDLVGIYATLDFQANDRTIHAPGFTGNVWDQIKNLMSANQVELAFVGDSVVVRELRGFEAYRERESSYSFGVNTQESSVSVEVLYRNNRPISRGEVYPLNTEEPSIHTVAAGEVEEWEVELDASLTTVYQPEARYEITPGDFSGGNGVYVVVGQDNLPIQPAQWEAQGGRIDITIGEDPSVINIRLMGANIPHLSPFRIAESAGGTDYNSLHITGDGVAWDTKSVLLYTGADPLHTSSEVGVTVDNPYLSTPSQAFTAGQHAAAAYSGSQVHISGEAVSINRATADKRPVRAQFRDVDLQHEVDDISTMQDWDDAYDGETMLQWDQRWEGMYRELFANQVFGNVSGARVRADDAYYRIDDTTIGPGSLSYTATLDTLISDFDKVWENSTKEEFEQAFADLTMKDFSSMPLWRGENV